MLCIPLCRQSDPSEVEFQIQSLDQRAGASFEDMAHISQPILELRLAVSLLSALGVCVG